MSTATIRSFKPERVEDLGDGAADRHDAACVLHLDAAPAGVAHRDGMPQSRAPSARKRAAQGAATLRL